jgi:protein-disulfide isomerase
MTGEMQGQVLQQPVDGHDHTLGPDGAAVTLVEYGDYHSSACGEAHALVQRARERLGERLRFCFRHFPMTRVHPYAQHASEAAEAAGSQGKFWEMHNALFAHRGPLDDGNLVEYADALGLDTARFLREVASHVHADRIQEQVQGGVASGVHATPAFFINGVRFDGEAFEDGLLGAVEQAATPTDLSAMNTP